MSLKEKLIKVERTVNVYLKNEDIPTTEVNVDIIPFSKLLEIIDPHKDDPLLYDGYKLRKKQLLEINQYLTNKITPNFKKYNYILVCGGVYNW